MASQLLEILRQGFWASATGGYFYDPNQSFFCNAVHLYLWLYLLCSPFAAYIYFRKSWMILYVYCCATSLLLLLLKLFNLALHIMCDRAQAEHLHAGYSRKHLAVEEANRSDNANEFEMKELNTNTKFVESPSPKNKPKPSAVDKESSIVADVHRKNSSESVRMADFHQNEGNEYSETCSTHDKAEYEKSAETDSPSSACINLPKNSELCEIIEDNCASRPNTREDKCTENYVGCIKLSRQEHSEDVVVPSCKSSEQSPRKIMSTTEGSNESKPTKITTFLAESELPFQAQKSLTDKQNISQILTEHTRGVREHTTAADIRKASNVSSTAQKNGTVSASQSDAAKNSWQEYKLNIPEHSCQKHRLCRHFPDLYESECEHEDEHENSVGELTSPGAIQKHSKHAKQQQVNRYACFVPRYPIDESDCGNGKEPNFGFHGLESMRSFISTRPATDLCARRTNRCRNFSLDSMPVYERTKSLESNSDEASSNAEDIFKDFDWNGDDCELSNAAAKPNTAVGGESSRKLCHESYAKSENPLPKKARSQGKSDTKHCRSGSKNYFKDFDWICDECGLTDVVSSKRDPRASKPFASQKEIFQKVAERVQENFVKRNEYPKSGNKTVGSDNFCACSVQLKDEQQLNLEWSSLFSQLDLMKPQQTKYHVNHTIEASANKIESSSGHAVAKSLGSIPKVVHGRNDDCKWNTNALNTNQNQASDLSISCTQYASSSGCLQGLNTTNQSASSQNACSDNKKALSPVYDYAYMIRSSHASSDTSLIVPRNVCKDQQLLYENANETFIRPNSMECSAKYEPFYWGGIYHGNADRFYPPQMQYSAKLAAAAGGSSLSNQKMAGLLLSPSTSLNIRSPVDKTDNMFKDLRIGAGGSVEAESVHNHQNMPTSFALNSDAQDRAPIYNDSTRVVNTDDSRLGSDRALGVTLLNYDCWSSPCMFSANSHAIPTPIVFKYKWKFLGHEHNFMLLTDRLELLALFDRDPNWWHVLLSFVLCLQVAFFGAYILMKNYYRDLSIFLFCSVIASAQYSLMKSVQPDAASPIHGFNKIVAYSRAIYFCLFSAVLLLIGHVKASVQCTQEQPPLNALLFGIQFSPLEVLTLTQDMIYAVLLLFPVIFLLGLAPQLNTFLMYLFEQIEMHVFGGSAASSLLSSFLCIVRSLVAVGILYAPIRISFTAGKGPQYIIFSMFCAMTIPIGYHLSRSTGDFNQIWDVVKMYITSEHHDAGDSRCHSVRSTSKKCMGVERLGDADKATMHKISEKPSHMQTNPSALNESFVSRKSSITLKRRASSNTPQHDMKLSAHSEIAGQAAMYAVSISELDTTSATVSKSTILATNLTPATSDNKNTFGSEKDCETLLHGRDDEHNNNRSSNDVSKGSHVTEANQIADIGERNRFSKTKSKHENKGKNAYADDTCTTAVVAKIISLRFKSDLFVVVLQFFIILAIHCSKLFSILQPNISIGLYSLTCASGFVLHYVIPQMRKHMPWLCFTRPILKQKEFGQFEVMGAPKIMWFERCYVYLCFVERNILFPALLLSTLSADAQSITLKFGISWGSLIIVVCALKFIRSAYSEPNNQYLIITFVVLTFYIDFASYSETFLVDYFLVSLIFHKVTDLLLKLQFVVTYIAPWQITWGSAFHAFAQPFSVPHSVVLLIQALLSAMLSAPLNPFLGSAIFLTSYVRPIKFWEREYKTRRIDNSNTRLSAQLERNLTVDDNNLNSIFYEHLTRSLQQSLAGDLLLGRWGNVNQGDCFVLASDYLNCLVHIIEMGNGLCTFQLRGLEFRGTYCQQREVEAITEDEEPHDNCLWCDKTCLPRLLSTNAMFSRRWLAWQVVASQYVVEGYSISDNLASATLQVFEYRKMLISYYIKSIIYYAVKHSKLNQWLAAGPIQDSLQYTLNRNFVDLDPVFNFNLDEDFDIRAAGITRTRFCYAYLSWINYCMERNKNNITHRSSSMLDMVDKKPVVEQITHHNATGIKQVPPPPQPPFHSTNVTQQRYNSSSRNAPLPMRCSVSVNNTHSSEIFSNSQSFTNISLQTSESSPGLIETGVGSNYLKYLSTCLSTNQALRGISLRSTTMTQKTDRMTGGGGALALLQSSVNECNGNTSTARKPDLAVGNITKDSPLVSLCFALSLLGRRSLATASHNSPSGIESFLYGLHSLFKGDFRITSARDEWVFSDMELLHSVVVPAVKMALKLQQDHVSNPDDFNDFNFFYQTIDLSSKNVIISHEADPAWRSAVLSGAPNLLALRHVIEDGADEYRIIRLTKRFLSFRAIKLNRECVRGLWAGQQQELIFLRNRNPERGSIQNAKQALRNIINSSCDQPIGYPIYVSPLTTSYADTNKQLAKVIGGGSFNFENIRPRLALWWQRVYERFQRDCISGSFFETLNFGVNNTIANVTPQNGAVNGVVETRTRGPIATESAILNALPTPNECDERRQADQETGTLLPMMMMLNTVAASDRVRRKSTSTSMSMGRSNYTPRVNADSLALLYDNFALLPSKPMSSTLLSGFMQREHNIEYVDGLAVFDEEPAMKPLRGICRPNRAGHESFVSRNARSNSQNCYRIDRLNQVRQSSCYGSLSLPSVSEGGNGNDNGNGAHSQSQRYGSGDSTDVIITSPREFKRKTKGPICLRIIPTSYASKIKAGDGGSGNSNPNPKSISTDTLAHCDGRAKPRIGIYVKVVIIDDVEVYDYLNANDDIVWPDEQMRSKAGRLAWGGWQPAKGMVGHVVHHWVPKHKNPLFRSHVNRVLYLIEVGEFFVAIEELGLYEYHKIAHATQNSTERERGQQQQQSAVQLNMQMKLSVGSSHTPIIATCHTNPSSSSNPLEFFINQRRSKSIHIVSGIGSGANGSSGSVTGAGAVRGLCADDACNGAGSVIPAAGSALPVADVVARCNNNLKLWMLISEESSDADGD